MQSPSNPLSISIVGSGNVATRFCHAFKAVDVQLNQLLSFSGRGTTLSQNMGMELISKACELDPCDVVLLCVKDDVLNPEFLQQFKGDYLLCHTSGSVGMDVFPNNIRSGVFYPLQSLSASKPIDFSDIPLCLETKEPQDYDLLEHLGHKISNNIVKMDSEQRKQVHLSAVFVSNFVNHLYFIAQDLLKEQHLDFDILKPLIAEIAQKINYLSPKEAQTGPALRSDTDIINKHLKMLQGHKDYQDIYKRITESIIENHKQK